MIFRPTSLSIVGNLRLQQLPNGGEQPKLSTSARLAIDKADAIIIAPSNPWLSIAPILAVEGAREAIANQEIPRVAVTPLIAGKAVKGPTAKLMAELGYEVALTSIVSFYNELINGFIYDKQDEPFVSDNIRCVALNTYMQTKRDKIQLAEQLMNWIREFNQ